MIEMIASGLGIVVVATGLCSAAINLFSNKIYMTNIERAIETNLSKAKRSVVEYTSIAFCSFLMLIIIVVLRNGLFQGENSYQEITQDQLELILNNEEEQKKRQVSLIDKIEKSNKLNYIQKIEKKETVNQFFREYSKEDSKANLVRYNNMIRDVESIRGNPLLELVLVTTLYILLIVFYYYQYRSFKNKVYVKRTFIKDINDEIFYIIKRIKPELVLLESAEGINKIVEMKQIYDKAIYNESREEVNKKRRKYFFAVIKDTIFDKKIFKFRVITYLSIFSILTAIATTSSVFIITDKMGWLDFVSSISIALSINLMYITFQTWAYSNSKKNND